MSHPFSRLFNSCRHDAELLNVLPEIHDTSKALATLKEKLLETVR